jgi:hypothetical protein
MSCAIEPWACVIVGCSAESRGLGAPLPHGRGPVRVGAGACRGETGGLRLVHRPETGLESWDPRLSPGDRHRFGANGLVRGEIVQLEGVDLGLVNDVRLEGEMRGRKACLMTCLLARDQFDA